MEHILSYFPPSGGIKKKLNNKFGEQNISVRLYSSNKPYNILRTHTTVDVILTSKLFESNMPGNPEDRTLR